MAEPSVLEEAAAFTRLTLPLMVEHGIPTTPKNYATWYQYVSGTDAELKGAIDRILEEGRPFTRGTDLVARYGGEEFSVLLPETPLEGAERVAENVRMVFAQGRIKKVGSSTHLGQITVSIGVGQYHPNETAVEFVQRSDQALYFAKENGRNRVATESDLLRHADENKKVVSL